jgi:surface-anchored protein
MKWLGLTFVFAAFLSFSGREAVADIWIGGHGDIGAGYDSGTLKVGFHFEGVDSEAAIGLAGPISPGEAPSDAHIIGITTAPTARLSGTQWGFLGVNAGENFFLLPGAEVVGLPYLGFGLEELTESEWVGDLTWTVNSLVAPSGSEFSIYSLDGFGEPNVLASTTQATNNSFEQLAGTHSHYNLAFSQAGTYEIAFKISGTHAVDGIKQSDFATFTFQVSAVPEPTSFLLLGSVLSSGAAFAWRRKFARRNSPLAN